MTAFSLEHLKDAMKLAAHAVPLPELGEGVIGYVAELSADERDERLEVPWLKRRELTGDDSNAGFRAFAVAACWCDADRKFVAPTSKDVAAAAAKLGQMDSRPITKLFVEAAKANGLTDDDEPEKN